MKSIIEKAKEVQASGYDDVQAPAVGRGFILGANYVLEELEKVIHNSSICEKAIFDLGKLVIQLKK